MKRSGTVGLVVMGGAAFAATFAGGMTYLAMQKPSHAAQTQAAAPAQTCTTRPDGTQQCEPTRRGFAYYLLPNFMLGSSANNTAASARPQPVAFSASSGAPTAAPSPPPVASPPPPTSVRPAVSTPSPPPAQSAALTNNPRLTTPATSPSGAQRGGFGSTASSSTHRVSSGG